MTQHAARVMSERDRELLRLIGEQYLVTLPQLAYLADRSERTARWLRTRWQRAGLVNAAMLLVEEPTIVWLTRRGLACLDLPWKEVRPNYHSIQSAAALVELRLAAAVAYPAAAWVSRRALAHRRPLEPPLPDALLQTGTASVAVVANLRLLNRHEIEERVGPIVGRHEHTLLVLPSVGEHLTEWVEEQGGRVSALGFRRDPRIVRPPVLPPLPALERAPVDPHGSVSGGAARWCPVSASAGGAAGRGATGGGDASATASSANDRAAWTGLDRA